MTSVDVIAGIAICLFLLTMLLGCLSRTNGASNGQKCANNLRQIGLAALMYANGEVRTGAYPRTCFNTTSTNLIVDTTGYGKRNSFDRDAVGDNNVTASFFLILKTQDITPDVFICPSTTATAGFGSKATIKIQDSANWESIPGNMTYSYACPFPTADAIKNGWKFNNTLGSDFPMAADLNPGGAALLKLTPTSSAGEIKAGNSRNHNSEGQEVLYCDGHVEFQNTPFCGCGSLLTDKSITSRDNIYTTGGPSDSKGGDAVVAMPVSPFDAVLLPTGYASPPAAK
jgi:hypothetical protein